MTIAQTRTVAGSVIDEEDGLPMIGAYVLVDGTELGTVTDIDGNFEISGIPSSAISLTVSYMGMKTVKHTIQSGNNVVYLRSEAKLLDEFVQIAYGTEKKLAFTGSVSTFKAEKLAERKVADVTQALSGQMAGVQTVSGSGQPGLSATVRIRGFGSMSASNTPLYVVDGVPFDGSISSINPNDIESVSVQKDAAANAIYGARGSNGVILITTKRASGKEARVTFDATWGVNQREVPNYNVISDPALYYETQYKSLYNSKYYNGSTETEAHAYANAELINSLGYQVYDVPAGERMIGTDFKLNPNAKLGHSDGTYYYIPDNWYDELFKSDNLRQEYNVTVSGANDKLNYYLSVGYLDDSGLLENSGFKRYSGRANVDYQAKKWLKVGSNLAYSYCDMQEPTQQGTWGSDHNAFFVANMLGPIHPLYVRDTQGNIMYDQMGNRRYDFGNTTNSVRNILQTANPLANGTLNKFNQHTDNLTTKWFATLTPIDGFSFTATLGVNVQNYRYNTLYNQFYGSAVNTQGYTNVEHYRQFGVNQQYFANYKFEIEQNHFNIMAGYESYERKIQNLGGANTMLFNPFVGELDNAHMSPPASLYSNTHTYSTKGYIARVQYDYDETYFMSLSYRRDASSRFHPDNRWGNFGSVGASWLINKEAFMENASFVDVLKLKASYGVQGNDNLGSESFYYYPYMDQYNVTNSGGEFSISFAFKGNKDITWEKSHAWNIGTEFELFGHRLVGGVEYFHRRTSDLLYDLPIPDSFGYSSIPTNVGEIVNQGVELELTGTVFKNDNIEWTASANATWYKNEITDLHADKKKDGIKGNGYIYKIGGSLYNVYMRQYAGVDKATGLTLYYVDPDNGNYSTTTKYEEAQQADLGSSLANVYGGFGTQVHAYGFDFSVQFSYQLGGKIFDSTYGELMHSGESETAGFNWHKDILKSWTPSNTDTDVPRLCSTDNLYQLNSSRFLKSSDYLSLNSIVLGYTLPKRLTCQYGIEKMRVFVSGDNLALWSARRGLDPRFSYGGGKAASDYGSGCRYAFMRTLTAGISLTF